MTCIGFPTWNKEYAYVNPMTGALATTEAGDLATMTLNIFQRIARACFGYHANTHLKSVGKAARTALFDPNFSSNQNKAAIMRLAEKPYPKNDHEQEKLFLGEEKLGNDTVRYEASFGYEWPEFSRWDPGAYKVKSSLDSLCFQITVNPNGEKKTVEVQVRKKGCNIYLSEINPKINGETEGDRLLARVTTAFLRTLVSQPNINQLHLEAKIYGILKNTTPKTSWSKMDEYLWVAREKYKITPETLADDPECHLNIPISIDFMRTLILSPTFDRLGDAVLDSLSSAVIETNEKIAEANRALQEIEAVLAAIP